MYKLILILFAFVSLVIPVLAVPMPVFNEIDGVVQRDTTFTGKGTFFTPGLGACGVTSTSDQLVVAIPASVFGASSGANAAHCGQKVNIASGGKSAQATVVDKCETCGDQDIDMSPALFKEFADLAAGSIDVTWNFV